MWHINFQKTSTYHKPHPKHYFQMWNLNFCDCGSNIWTLNKVLFEIKLAPHFGEVIMTFDCKYSQSHNCDRSDLHWLTLTTSCSWMNAVGWGLRWIQCIIFGFVSCFINLLKNTLKQNILFSNMFNIYN